MTRHWVNREEELFKKAWTSGKYDRKTLSQIFNRPFTALMMKAKRLELPVWSVIEAEAEIKAIEEALKRDHVI